MPNSHAAHALQHSDWLKSQAMPLQCSQTQSLFCAAARHWSNAQVCDTEARALTAPRDYIAGSLTCRVTDEDSCGDKFDTFLERCYYQPGQYAEESDFKALSDRMSETEKVIWASQSA